MRNRDTIIVEYLPSLRTSDMKDWDTVSNQRLLGKDRRLLSYLVSYELTKHGLFLSYSLEGRSKEQVIDVLIEPSNLGVGEVWYMQCPLTQKKCRKLVLWNGQFVHQSVIDNLHYEQQTESNSERMSKKWIRRFTEYQRLLKEQMSAHYKSTYAGRSTKKAIQATRALHRYAAAINNQAEVYACFHKKFDPKC
jgi:hypothetical protein